jgi:hypothetical protein
VGRTLKTYAEMRIQDPAIKEILLILRQRNIQNPDYSAIQKILIEGADGRYLQYAQEGSK